MRASTSQLAPSRGPVRRHRVDKAGLPRARSLEARRVPRLERQSESGPRLKLARMHKVPPHPVLSPMAARIAAPLPSTSQSVDTGIYTPRDPSLPVLRALPIKPPEVHVPVFPLAKGFEQDTELTLHQRLAARQVVPVPSEIFDADEKPALLHTAVVSHLASLRSSLATNKGRSSVTYSTRKRRPQKGTGRARMSDLTAPQFRHGGRAFPKTPMRNWKRSLNGTAWTAAMCSALSMRWRDGGVVCIDAIPTFNGLGVPGYLPGIPIPVMIGKGHTHELRRMLEDRGLYGGSGTLFLLGHDTADWHEGKSCALSHLPTPLRPGTHFVRVLRSLQSEGVDVKRALDVNIIELLRYRRILFDARGLGDLVARLQSDRGLLGSEVWPLRLADDPVNEPDEAEPDEEEIEEEGTVYVDEALHAEADRSVKQAKKQGSVEFARPGSAEQMARLGHQERFTVQQARV